MDKLEVYFSKLPKNCLECPCFQSDEMCCGLDDGTQDYFKDEIDGGKCPLKKIHSHNSLCEKIDNLRKENFHLKKQLHKEKQEIVNEVCEKIREHLSEQKKSLKDTFSHYSNGKAFIISAVEENLNKIEKELDQ